MPVISVHFILCMFLSDGSHPLMRIASKGKTAKKKTKGEEGLSFTFLLSVFYYYYKHIK